MCGGERFGAAAARNIAVHPLIASHHMQPAARAFSHLTSCCVSSPALMHASTSATVAPLALIFE